MNSQKSTNSPLDTVKQLADRNLTVIGQLGERLSSGTSDRETILQLVRQLQHQQYDALAEHFAYERHPSGGYQFEEATLVFDDGTPVREHILTGNVLTIYYPRIDDESEVRAHHEEQVRLEQIFDEGHDGPPDDR